MNKGNEKRIDLFQNNSQRRILKIKWQDKITTQEILQLSNMSPMSHEIKCKRRKFIGDILRKKPISMIVALPFPGHLKAEEGEKDQKQHGEEHLKNG